MYQSVQTTTWTGASSINITKPTGLAVGDLMFAFIVNDNAVLADINTPSGWTAHSSSVGTGSGDDPRLEVFYKVADSSDVAASQFTFSQTSAVRMAGAILHITDWGFIDQTSVGITVTGGNISGISGVTPTRANELLIMVVVSEDASGNDATYSGYAIATSNPTWTEIFDLSDGSDTGGFACAVATRPESTATGNASITVGGSPGVNTEHIVRLISIAPRVDGSHAADPVKVNAYALTPIQSRKVNAVSDTPSTTIHSDPPWENTMKPSVPTWSNTNK